MKRVLSGIQPSGELHLGNYFGMMSRMIRSQNENDLFCFIVNYHALTTIQDKVSLTNNTLNAAMDFISLGLDPEKSTFWVQSDVPQVCESTWLLSNIVNLELITSPTGDILIPIIGTINIKGKVLNDVYDMILKKCKDKYEDARIYVNLIKK